MEKELKVTGLDLLRISPLGEDTHAYKEDTKMKGQSFRKYKFNGKVFIVNVSERQFIESQKAGRLNCVNLEMNEEGQLSFVDCITQEQYKNFRLGQVEDAKIDGQMNYYKTAKFVPTAINSTEEIPS